MLEQGTSPRRREWIYPRKFVTVDVRDHVLARTRVENRMRPSGKSKMIDEVAQRAAMNRVRLGARLMRCRVFFENA